MGACRRTTRSPASRDGSPRNSTSGTVTCRARRCIRKRECSGRTSTGRMAQPLFTWVPSIAPSGMAFYTGERFPRWRGDLFVGALRDEMLVRLKLDGEKVVREERLLKGVLGRIRDVRGGPDGCLYLLTDEDHGVLARLEP